MTIIEETIQAIEKNSNVIECTVKEVHESGDFELRVLERDFDADYTFSGSPEEIGDFADGSGNFFED